MGHHLMAPAILFSFTLRLKFIDNDNAVILQMTKAMRQIVYTRMAKSLIATPHMRCLVLWQAWYRCHHSKRPAHFQSRETSCSCRRRPRRTGTWRMAAREQSSQPRRGLPQEVYQWYPFAPPLLVQLLLQPHRLLACWCSTAPVSRVEAQHRLALAPKRGWHCSLV